MTKNYKFKKVEIEKATFISTKCDICYTEYFDSVPDIYELQEMQHIEFVGGYGSVFGDGKLVELDICQHCLKKLIDEGV